MHTGSSSNDIDIFYCSSGSGLDGDELRRRLSVMARSCQLQMLGVAAGDADERESLYDAFSKRPYAPCLDDVDEACVAAFAREQLMSLCSLPFSRSLVLGSARVRSGVAASVRARS